MCVFCTYLLENSQNNLLFFKNYYLEARSRQKAISFLYFFIYYHAGHRYKKYFRHKFFRYTQRTTLIDILKILRKKNRFFFIASMNCSISLLLHRKYIEKKMLIVNATNLNLIFLS